MGVHAYWDTWVTAGSGHVIRQIPYSALRTRKIHIGSRDFVIKGHRTDIVRWLLKHQDVPIVTNKEYGDKVYLILRGVAPTVQEEFAKAFAGNFAGVSGPGTAVATMTQMGLELGGASQNVTQITGALQSALTNPSSYSADTITDEIGEHASQSGGGTKKPSKFARLIDNVFGSSMILRISAAKGTFSDRGVAKGSIGMLPSGANCAAIAGAFAHLDF
jgi:hypothetical protein